MSKTQQDIQALIDAERKRLSGEVTPPQDSLTHPTPSSEPQAPDQEVLNLIEQERTNLAIAQERDRLNPKPEAGFLESTGDFLGLSARLFFNKMSPEDQARLTGIGAGAIQTAILEPAQAIAQIPGLFTAREIMTDRWAEYLARASQGAFNEAEKFAMSMGLDAREVGEYNSIGRFAGFTLPMIASEGAVSLFMRDGIRALKFVEAGNLVRDLSAGAIYGGVLKPGDDVKSRVSHMLNESAAFGIGRLVFSGLQFPFMGWKLQRYSTLQAQQQVKELLARMANGEEVLFKKGDELALQSLSEEGFILGSEKAQELIRSYSDERALVQGILEANTGKAEAGMVRNVGKSWSDVQETLAKFRDQFPGLKFDAIKVKEAGEGYHVVFGTQGLNNVQKAHFKSFGRYPGQVVEKAGASYEYVRPGKKTGTIVVKTSNGAVRTIKEEGITDTFGIVEESNNTALQDLYEAFRSDLPQIQRDLAKTARTPMTEEALIESVKNGTLKDIAGERRPFDVGFAVTYPEEIGAITNPEDFYRMVMENGMSFATDLPGGRITSFDEMVELWARGKGLDRTSIPRRYKWSGTVSHATDLKSAQNIQREGFDPSKGFIYDDGDIPGADGSVFFGFPKGTDWSKVSRLKADMSARIEADVGLRNPLEIRSDKDIPASIVSGRADRREWNALENKYDGIVVYPEAVKGDTRAAYIFGEDQIIAFPNADISVAGGPSRVAQGTPQDFTTLKSYFAQKARNEFWSNVPAEDRAIFEKIQTQFQELVESGAVPFEALAHNKGFSTFREGEKVILRDINSGMRMTFTNEQVARDAVAKIIRPEKDMLGGFGAPPFGNTGIGAMTGGFDPTDGFFSMDGSSISADLLEDMPLFSGLRNMRDNFINVEKITGVPTFSKVFDKLDEGLTAMRNSMEPWSKEIEAVWKGVSKKEKNQIVEFWRNIEGQDLSAASMIEQAKRAGLSPKQISTLRRSNEMFDAWHAMSGLPKAQYISFYYSRVQPYAMSRGGSVNESFWKGFNIPKEFSWWAENTRTGNLSNVEMNPEIVMHKYVRGLMFKTHVEETYNAALSLTKIATTPKLRDLPPSVQNLIKQKRPGVNSSTPVLGEHVRGVLAEYLNIVRGAPTSAQTTTRRFFRNFMDHLGVQVDDRVLDEFSSIALQNMYGAAMALRPALTARNAVQNIWLQYTRLGGRQAGRSMERALTQEGYQEALDALAIRNTTAGLPMGDVIWEDFLTSTPIQGKGVMGSAIAGTMRMAMRGGKMSGNLAKKWLVPYSSTDDMNRAWSYWWQKMHTEEWLTKYESSNISWDKFLDEGLPMFDDVVRDGFAQRYHKFGREQALKWIGKQGADETNFIYGVGAQPAWMQKPAGRFFGMFGTWPIWSVENYLRRPPKGTAAQMAGFYARTLALTGAFANMTMQSGIDLWNWIAPNSFMSWTGGPAVDDLIQLKQVMDAPIDQKAQALKILSQRVGSLAVPGQVFLMHDVRRSLEAPDAMQAGLRLMLGKPVDDPEWPMNFYSNDFNGDPILPYTQDTLLKMPPPRLPAKREGR